MNSKYSNLIKDVKVGEEYIVSADGTLFSGELQSINARSLTLINVRNLSLDEEDDGHRCYLRHFYFNDIETIYAHNKSNGKSSSETGASSSSSTHSSESESGSVCENVLSLAEKAIYLHQVDVRYFNAIDDIGKQMVIGVNMENGHVGRFSTPSLLVIATAATIYIFDLQFLGSWPRELLPIMENDKCLKVIHNSRSFISYLLHKFNVGCKRVFDTMIAHISQNATVDKSELTVEQCAMLYLQLPPKFFGGTNLKEHPIDWQRRPLDDNLKSLCAKRVGITIPLYDHILHNVLLAPFYANCNSYITALTHSDDGDAFKVHLPNTDIELIQPFELNINSL